MSRLLCLALLAVLSTAQLGGSCEDAEAVPLEELRRDVAPSFDYDLYSDAAGTLVGERSAVLLVYRSSHLERVYADAQADDGRAQVLFGQLEDTVHRTGEQLAARATGLVCHSAPSCAVQWHFLEELMPSQGPGGQRLRQRMADSFSRAAKTQRVRNAVIAGALNVLLVATVVKAGAAEVEASAAQTRVSASETAAGAVEAGRLALAGVEARLAAEEVAALEARMVEAEAEAMAARHPARLEVLARHRPSRSEPPSGVEAGRPRWTGYMAYWERRYEELAGTRPVVRSQAEVKPPLTWEGYSALMDRFQRSLEFQRAVTRFLQQGAAEAQGQWDWLRGMKKPRADANVGLKREGSPSLVYADDLILDEATLRPGIKSQVHSVSTKQHDFRNKSPGEARAQLRADSLEARNKYGGTVEVRRPGHPLFGRKVEVSQVHLVYDGANLSPLIRDALTDYAPSLGVKLHLYVP